MISSITSQPGGSVYLQPSDTLSVGRIFSGRLSYNKGAMVLHMLRKKVGDSNFFTGMKSYLDSPQLSYGYAKTEDYKNDMEASSGKDLDEFFNDWIYMEGYPTYKVEWKQLPNKDVVVKLSQSQSSASVNFFEAKVPIRFIAASGESVDLVFDNTENDQSFSEPLNFQVESVIFDPESDLISKENEISLNTELQSPNAELLIFPNPVISELYIKKPGAMRIERMALYDTLGQLLFNLNYQENLNLGSLSSGAYFLKLQTSEGTITKSLLKN